MSILMIVGETIGLLGFLFLLWRRLKEDYPAQLIFSFASWIVIPTLIIHLVIKYIVRQPNYWFVADVGGLALGFAAGIAHHKLKFYETLEGVAVGGVFWLAVIFTFDGFGRQNLVSVIGALLLYLLVAGFFLLDKHYKNFGWYKSGKIGFSGLAVLGFFFLVRALAFFVPSDVLSLTGRLDAIASGAAAFAFFLLLYNLSVQKA